MKQTKRSKKCRKGSKSVNAACVRSTVLVTAELPRVIQDDLSYARDYLVVLPQRIRDVQQAAEAVLRTEGRR